MSMFKPLQSSTTTPTPALPEIDATDLKAARLFLTSVRDEERRARMPHVRFERQGPVVHNGITRARMRSANKTSA
jgi:hypothetical protein